MCLHEMWKFPCTEIALFYVLFTPCEKVQINKSARQVLVHFMLRKNPVILGYFDTKNNF